MATVVVAPDNTKVYGVKVFLAGAIDMGAAVDWQQQVIEALDEYPGFTLLNPRRAEFAPDTLDEQIAWELDALNNAHIVLMWFPAQAKAPIALLETGLYMQSEKLLIGAEPGFYRRRNLEMTCDYYGVTLHDSLADVIAELKLWDTRTPKLQSGG